MTVVVKHATKNTEEKAAAALKDLEQAWAYYEPEALPTGQEERSVEGYTPYYEAA